MVYVFSLVWLIKSMVCSLTVVIPQEYTVVLLLLLTQQKLTTHPVTGLCRWAIKKLPDLTVLTSGVSNA